MTCEGGYCELCSRETLLECIFHANNEKGQPVSKYRQAARVDSNQSAIVKALRAIPGISVEVGHDDILVGRGGVNYWYEIKNPEQVSTKSGQIRESAIKPDQKRIRRDFTGHYKIVSSLDEILLDMGLR